MPSGHSILRNSLLLYGRMILVMGAGLLLSRLLLSAMGVPGYGVYSLLWGLVTLLAFFEFALTTAFQRFFGNDIGAADPAALQADFGASVVCSLISSGLLLALGVIVAFVALPYLDIPQEIRPMSWWLMLLCLGAMAIRFLRIPLLSLLLSREQMGAFAAVSVAEALLKLLVAIVLPYIPYDSLPAYCVALPAIDGLVAAALAFFCRGRAEAQLKWPLARPRVAPMLRFAAVNALGSGAEIGVRQGCNIVVNLFFGVVLNASVGICSQVRTAVKGLAGSVQTAVAPRIFSLYGAGLTDEVKRLICSLSQLSFLLTALVTIPLGVCAEEVLRIWLGTIPPWAPEMFAAVCMVCLIDSLNGPLWVAIVAHGRIWRYYSVVSLIMFLNIPVVAVAYHFGADPVALYVVEGLLLLCVLGVRIVFAARYDLVGAWYYTRKVFLPLIGVGAVGFAAAHVALFFHSFLRIAIALICSWGGLLLSFKLLCLRSRSIASVWCGDAEASMP